MVLELTTLVVLLTCEYDMFLDAGDDGATLSHFHYVGLIVVSFASFAVGDVKSLSLNSLPTLSARLAILFNHILNATVVRTHQKDWCS